MSGTPYAFFRGEFIPLSEAKVSVMTHALHYGTGVFEGIRGNWNPEDRAIYIFRQKEHYERLLRGCQLMMLEIPYDCEELCRITTEVVERSGYREDLYIRPLAYKSAEKVANLKLHELENDFLVMAIPFGRYISSETVRCCTSSWRRVEDSMIPTRLKISGLYVNSILAKTEAVLSGFDEAILLNEDSHVSEGTGENLFLVTEGHISTPPLDDNVLPGITRETVMVLAREELGLEVSERHIDRSELYSADECFLTGTAAHVTPVVEIDHRKIGTGQAGPITERLQQVYSDVIIGKNEKYLEWCTRATPQRVSAQPGD